MKSDPVIHHYVSKFYLKGFSTFGDSKSKIHVYDKSRRKYFVTSPRNIAAERNFNRIDIKGEENAIENGYSMFEAEAAQVFKYIINSERLPDPDGFATLMNFVCLLTVRNPNTRQKVGDFRKEVSEKAVGLALSNKDIYESQIRQIEKKTGEKHDVPYEEVKSFFDSKKYVLEIPTDFFVDNELRMLDKMLPYFFQRNWSIVISSSQVGEFVTSDHPVSLLSNFNSGNRGVGFGTMNTEVTFPVSKHICLIGRFEDTYPRTIRANRNIVANINGRTVERAKDQVYSSHKLFYYFDVDGKTQEPTRLISI